MLEFLSNAFDLREGLAYMVTFHQAGFNMIPQIGWRQSTEAWAASKIGESK